MLMILKGIIRRSTPFAWTLLLLSALVSHVPAQTPAAEWKLAGGSGNTSTDLYAADHDAILSKNIRWVSGTSGWAVSADAENKGYVTAPSVDLRQTHGVTVALWTNRTYTG